MATQSMCMIIHPSPQSKTNILVTVSPASTFSSRIHHPHRALLYHGVSTARSPHKALVIFAGLESTKTRKTAMILRQWKLFTTLVCQHYGNANLVTYTNIVLIEDTGDLAKEIHKSIASHLGCSQFGPVTDRLLLTPDINSKRSGREENKLIIRFIEEYTKMGDFRKIFGKVDSNGNQILIAKKERYFFNPETTQKDCLSKDRLRVAFEYLYKNGGKTIGIPELFFG